MSSARQVYRSELHAQADGSHACKHCSTHFSVKSGLTAWKKHFKSHHVLVSVRLEAAVATLGAAAPAAAAAATRQEEMELDSLASAAAPPSALFSVGSSSISSSSASSSPSSKKLKRSHDALQPTITDVLDRASFKGALASLARAFAHSSIAYRVVETEEFREFLRCVGWKGSLPSRQSLSSSVLAEADTLRSELAVKFENAVLSLAVDGWTNVRHEKVTNIVPILDGVAFYWRSLVNSAERNTAEWLAANILPVLHSLIDDYGARIIAFVVDNEAVNRAAFELLQRELPFLIHVPCAAHTIQLIVRSCLKHERYASTAQQLADLIRHFDAKENRMALRRIQEARQLPVLAVLRPNDTRWSSTLLAAERMMRMRKEVETCYDEETLPSVDAAFFPALSALIDFLKPFQVATDIVQRDTSTLFTVYETFITLQRHVRDKDSTWAASRIIQRWEKNVNAPATVACAILSFARVPSGLSIQAAQDFIVHVGAAYLHYYHLCDDSAKLEDVQDALLAQIAAFHGRTGRFASIEAQKNSFVRSSSGALNPRLVWLLYPDVELGKVAVALLSVAASEAAVERTFSAQSAVHTKKRNRLLSTAVEAEMFVKFNARALKVREAQPVFGSVRELTDSESDSEDELFVEEGIASDASTSDEDQAETEQLEQKEQQRVQVVAPPAASAAAAASSAAPPTASQRRAARRASSIVFTEVNSFVAWFIDELRISASTAWNSDLRNSLQCHSATKLHPSPSSKELEKIIRDKLVSL